MTTLTASQILRREYGPWRNMMAPNRIKAIKLSPNVACEFAWGHQLDKSLKNTVLVYRVTVVVLKPDGTTAKAFDCSHCFTGSAMPAQAYINALRISLRNNPDLWQTWTLC